MARPYSSPWWNPALHREWRGARLTRREEGAYWVYCNRGLQAVRPNNAVRRDASPLECSGDFHHGLIGAHRRRVAMPRGWRRWPGIRCRPPHLHHEEQPRDHRVDRGDLVGLAAATATTRPVSPAGLGSPTRPARKRAAATAVEALARRSTPGRRAAGRRARRRADRAPRSTPGGCSGPPFDFERRDCSVPAGGRRAVPPRESQVRELSSSTSRSCSAAASDGDGVIVHTRSGVDGRPHIRTQGPHRGGSIRPLGAYDRVEGLEGYRARSRPSSSPPSSLLGVGLLGVRRNSNRLFARATAFVNSPFSGVKAFSASSSA